MKSQNEIFALCDQILETSFSLHRYLRHGHLENVYETCNALASEHVAQLLGYLRACGIEHGLLINFGAPKLQIKKFALSDTK